MARRFELQDAGSAKFWEVSAEGSVLTVRFGKLGTEGQTKPKTLASPAAAQKEMEKLVREKTGKGYVEVGSKASRSPKAKDQPTKPVKGAGRTTSKTKGKGGSTSQAKTKGKAADEVQALRADGEGLLSAFGELTLLDGAEPGIVASFEAGSDGDRWRKVFDHITWVAEEADGGAVGYWSVGDDHAVAHLDNEGQLNLTGRTLVDHFAWFDGEGEYRVLLQAFCRKHGLPSPLSKSARQAALKGIHTPDELFEALGRASAPPAKPKGGAESQSPPAPKAKTAEKTTRGPRPLARGVASCVLEDGRVLVVTGEDFSETYGQPITRGATFTFDGTAFSAHPPLDESAERLMVPLAGSRALLLKPHATWENGKWRRQDESPIDVGFETQLYPLPDGSFLVFGSEYSTEAFRIVDGDITRIGDLPEPRGYDRMVELPDGRLWFGTGRARNEYFSTTRRTVLLDPKTWRFDQGPDLPTESPMEGSLFGLGDGRALFIAGEENDEITVYQKGAWSAPKRAKALQRVSDLFQLPDRSVVGVRYTDSAVARIDPSTLVASEVGYLHLPQSGAKAHELDDGRLLFVGGTAFENTDAEPEIWDPKNNTASPLPGYDKEMARQVKALAKYREKVKKRGY